MNRTKFFYLLKNRIIPVATIYALIYIFWDYTEFKDQFTELFRMEAWFIAGSFFIAISANWLQQSYLRPARSYKKLILHNDYFESFRRQPKTLVSDESTLPIDSIKYSQINSVKLSQSSSQRATNKASVEIYYDSDNHQELLILSNLPLKEARQDVAILEKIISSVSKNLAEVGLSNGLEIGVDVAAAQKASDYRAYRKLPFSIKRVLIGLIIATAIIMVIYGIDLIFLR